MNLATKLTSKRKAKPSVALPPGPRKSPMANEAHSSLAKAYVKKGT